MNALVRPNARMSWEPGGSARMRARCMHVTGPMLKNVAQQVGNALWGEPQGQGVDGGEDSPQGATDLN